MSFLKKLFGGGESRPNRPSAEEYSGFRITPQPVKDGPNYRIGAMIEKEINGETRVHTLIRADTLQSLEAAQEASVSKAKQIIDAQGDRLFD
ncbi:hypothetical protein C8N43_1357 [Litoreibacter ponti]|uniref:Transcriptional activator HlyU n=1 Tax=Litoreibacter ponti TaxID=1510457 RepID=A0A2T6BKX1_9RHOB|nr:HlyU family transcriptional regulator [Litoreibacter ponti]PTX56695.1 hypothetical protein C8N43_1357 [Litoreibacter ponti]